MKLHVRSDLLSVSFTHTRETDLQTLLFFEVQNDRMVPCDDAKSRWPRATAGWHETVAMNRRSDSFNRSACGACSRWIGTFVHSLSTAGGLPRGTLLAVRVVPDACLRDGLKIGLGAGLAASVWFVVHVCVQLLQQQSQSADTRCDSSKVLQCSRLS